MKRFLQSLLLLVPAISSYTSAEQFNIGQLQGAWWAQDPGSTAVFAILVGIEEFMDSPMVSEGLARTLVLVAGIALGEVLLLTCVFALAVCCFRKTNNAA